MNRPGLLRFAWAVFSLCVVTMALEGRAKAATGTITTTSYLWNQNGNYCPSTNACVGSIYPQVDFNSWKPVSNAKVVAYSAAGAIIGQGIMNDAGSTTLTWTATPAPAQAFLRIYPNQKLSAFYFTDTSGSLYNAFTAPVNLVSGGNTTFPNSFIGTQVAPNPYFNAYWAGELQWRRVLSLVGLLVTNFVNVEIRGFANVIPGYIDAGGIALSSRAFGPLKKIQLDTNAAYSPQGRVMHEMGHMASYLTNPFRFGSDYTWGGGAPSQWGFTTAEFGHVSFEEAISTHYGNMTLWGDNSVTPTTCLSAGHCYSAALVASTPLFGTNVEATSFPFGINNCSTAAAAPESRWPLSATRYLWDVFDNRNDADGDTYSANQSGHFWQHLANLASYPAGLGFFQEDEPWAPGAGGAVVLGTAAEKDGRGVATYRLYYASSTQDTNLLRVSNCSPP